MTSTEILNQVKQGKAHIMQYIAAHAQESVETHLRQKATGVKYFSFETTVFAPDGYTEIRLQINFTYKPAVRESSDEAGADEEIEICDIWERWQQSPSLFTQNFRVKYAYDFPPEQWMDLKDACRLHLEKFSSHE